MFTGIVQEIGVIVERTPTDQGVRLAVRAPETVSGLAVGDSVCTSGVCLTCVAIEGDVFRVDVSAETLRKTTLGDLAAGAKVNLEPALRLSDRLGGHVVTGHVDATGKLVAKEPEGTSALYTFWAPAGILRYTVEKGSIAVDGVSLTAFDIHEETFRVALIPHTLAATTLGAIEPGARVNLEADLFAKYVEKLFDRSACAGGASGAGAARPLHPCQAPSADPLGEDR